MRITDLPTPQVLIEQSRLRANIHRMQAAVRARGRRLRPHAKTHKSPLVARWQIDAGAAGVCCAKPGEAEVFVECGFTDIRLPYPVNPANAGRIVALMERAAISLVVDHPLVADGWSDAMRRAGRALDVLVKVDVGFHRCGIDPTAPDALGFIRRVAELPGLRLRGLLSHAGQAYAAGSAEELRQIAGTEAEMLRTLAAKARAAGVEIAEISVGATPTAHFSLEEREITELRPGNYVYYDRTQVGLGAASVDDCALTVMASVVSRPALDRVVLDCGSKTLSSDRARGFGAQLPGYGAVFPDLDAAAPDDRLAVERLSEEHAIVRAPGDSPLQPGDRVRVLPNHACVVSNLVDAVLLVDCQTIVERLPVAARGRIT